ncbi:hypothetical protein EOM09_08615 [bacterium]|nr:hypothetical protein [bacterium]
MGEFFGISIIILYVLTILKYIFRLINKYFGTALSKNEKFYNVYRKIVSIITKNHRVFGMLTILFILAHFIVEFSKHGIIVTGVIAASFMIIQILLGLYATITKKINKSWMFIHRLISILILVAILIHIS